MSELSEVPRVSFVLPSREPSGGVRVTAELAENLRQRGIDCRILHRQKRLRQRLRHAIFSRGGGSRLDWIGKRFGGSAVPFRSLRDVDYQRGEIVIAVGTMTVDEVRAIERPVIKARYCHGFSDHLGTTAEAAWTGSMPTLSVSSTLVPRLERISRHRVWGVVPNGIRSDEYFPDSAEFDRDRVAVGTIYNSNPKKAPDDIVEIVRRLRERRPSVPVLAFGSDRQPQSLLCSEYLRNATPQQTREIYNRCLVWFIASKSEGFCLPILEAMACGAAVVSSDHDSVGGLVNDGHNGILVPVGHIDRFVEQISDLLDQPERRHELVQQGLLTAKQFTWRESTSQMFSFLQDVASGWKPTPV